MNFATKLLLGSLSVLLVSSTVNMLYSYRISKEALRVEFAEESEGIASRSAEILQPYSERTAEVCRVAKEILDIHSLQYLRITRADTIVCDFGQKPSGDLNLALPEESRLAIERSRVYTTFASIQCSANGCDPFEIEVGISFARLDKSLAMLWRNQLSNTLALIVGTTLFLILFSVIVRRRLEKLSLACAKIQSGDLDLNLRIGGRDEISRVAEAMNSMARDLRLAAEERERQKRVLVHSSKMSALGEMAGGMAHEINNPLAIIKMTASQIGEILEEDPVDRLSCQKMIATIVKTSDRISKIILGLRAFSREGGNDPFVKVKLQDLIEETIVLCRDRFSQHEIDLKVGAFDPALDFEGRSTQISQVLLNLLNNAHDAVMKNEGARWVSIEVDAPGEFLEIRVTDCNPGISAEVQKKMFQPFFTTKEVGKGTGMGLSISMGIMKSHGGELVLDSSAPHTCFVIRLPKVQPNKAN